MKKIMIKIDGKKIETTIKNGVQRLPNNPTYSALFDCGALDLNELAIAYHRGKISYDSYLDYHLNSGYSVCDFAEMSAFQHLKIENPLWG